MELFNLGGRGGGGGGGVAQKPKPNYGIKKSWANWLSKQYVQ